MGEQNRRLRGWGGAALRHLAGLAGMVAALVTATFLVLHLVPGDPAVRVAGLNATPEQLASTRARLGLDRGIGEQFLDYVAGILRGDFGTSFQTGEPVSAVITGRVPVTAQLAVAGIVTTVVVAVLLGLGVGALTGSGRHRRLEAGFTTVASVIGAIPEYVIGTVLVAVFAVGLGWFPVAGGSGTGLVLPVLAVAIGPIAVLARIVRVQTLGVLAQDYVRTARARRLPPLRIHLRHVLPNAMTGALTVGGLLFASLLGGTVVVENVFAIPGLGSRLVEAVVARDYPVVQAAVLLLGLTILLVNTGVELAIGLLDPRSRTVRS